MGLTMTRSNMTRSSMTLGSLHPPDERRTLKTSERVAVDIVHDLVERGLSTGDRLPLEAEMVQQYAVSRESVREALRLLEVQGLIRLKPGPRGGPVVGSVDPAHLARTTSLYFHLSSATYAQLFDTQTLLEPLCASRAAEHPDRRAVMEPFTAASTPDDVRAYHLFTGDFHVAVYRLVDNSVLSLLTQAVTRMVTDHIVSTMDPVELHGSILEEHVVLARTISFGHASRASHLMREHFEAQHDYYAQRSPERLADLIEWR
jgi:GntR family transcriptional regulator, transcriptional repressor for pyruvate dehydrogenase complex